MAEDIGARLGLTVLDTGGGEPCVARTDEDRPVAVSELMPLSTGVDGTAEGIVCPEDFWDACTAVDDDEEDPLVVAMEDAWDDVRKDGEGSVLEEVDAAESESVGPSISVALFNKSMF